MKTPSAILLVVLSASVVQADVSRGLVSHIEWAQKTMNGANKCLAGERSAPSGSSADDVAILCASQICGASEDFTYFDELSVKLMSAPPSGEKFLASAAEVKSMLNAFLDSTLENKKLLVRGYKDLKSTGDLNPAPEFSRVHDLLAMLREFQNASFEAGPSEQNPIVINRLTTESQLAALPAEQRRWTVDALDQYTRSSLGGELMRQQTQQPREFFAKQYPGLSYAEALRVDGARVQKITNDLINGPQAAKMRNVSGAQAFFLDPVISKAANGQEMSESEVSEYMMRRVYALLYHDVLTPKEQGGQTLLPSGSSRESLPSFLQRVGFDGRIAQFEVELSSAQKVKEIKTAVLEQCYSNFHFHLQTSPTQEQIKQSQANGEWAKTRTKEVFAGYLSQQTQDSVNAGIDRITFSMPRSQEEFNDYFVGRLKSASDRKRDENRSYEGMIRSGQHRTETLSAVHLNDESFAIDQTFQEVLDFCNEFPMSFASDNMKLSTGAIKTSWVSARMPELGKSVMIHEIAHATYDTLSSNQASAESQARFQGVRQCLADNHPPESRESDFQFAEEDFSDLIAAKGMTHPIANIGCNLIGQYYDRYQFTELVNYYENEPHPTAFYRALFGYKVQKGNLPASCEQLLEAQPMKWNFNSCM